MSPLKRHCRPPLIVGCQKLGSMGTPQEFHFYPPARKQLNRYVWNHLSTRDGQEVGRNLFPCCLREILLGLRFPTNLLGNGEPSHTLLKVCLNLACWCANFSEMFTNLRVAWNLIQYRFSTIQGSLINVSQSSPLQVSKKRHCIIYGMLCSTSNPCEKAL